VSLDLTHLIDRLESIEEKANLVLGSLSAINRNQHGYELVVSGDCVFSKPPRTEYEVSVNVVVYDEQGRVSAKEQTNLGAPGSPFDAFSIKVDGNHASATKIRIYVTRDNEE
jgi:hypothetical protein